MRGDRAETCSGGSTCRLKCFGPFWMVNKKITKKVSTSSGQTLWLILSFCIWFVLVYWNISHLGSAVRPHLEFLILDYVAKVDVFQKGWSPSTFIIFCSSMATAGWTFGSSYSLAVGLRCRCFFLSWWDSQESFQIRNCTALQLVYVNIC